MGNAVNSNGARKKIWIDLDNSPHVPLFRPIIARLKQQGYDLLVTARDAYQVRELIEFYDVPATLVGKHYGKHKVFKALGTLWRAFLLIRLVRNEKPDLAVCHGSRGLLLTCTLIRIPAVALMDYEFGAELPFVKPKWLMVPSVLSEHHMGVSNGTIRYPGFKEGIYLSTFQPDRTLRDRLGISNDDIVILVRPPAGEAHYHNPEGDKLLDAVLNRFTADRGTKVLLLPRNKRQEVELRAAWAPQLASHNFLIPEHAEDGLNLIWNSDLVISGGGTMNREAAAMGVPVYSIFRGSIGAVDRYLAKQGRLVLLENAEDVRTKVKAIPRERAVIHTNGIGNETLEAIIDNLVSIVERNVPASEMLTNCA